jgi:exopolysaccharide production protein ExoQ
MNSIANIYPDATMERKQWTSSLSIKAVFYLFPLLLLMFATVFSPHKPLNTGNLLAISTAEWYRPYLFGGIYLLATVTLLTQPVKALLLASRHGIYLIFLLYVICSASWSAYPGKVVIIWLHFVGTYLVCLAAMLTPDVQRRNLIRMFLVFAGVSVVATLLIVAVNPERGVMDVGRKLRWIGFTYSANMLGVVMLIGIWGCWTALYSFRSQAARWVVILLMPIIAICLFKSDSMTSLLLAIMVSLAFPIIMRIGRLSPLQAAAILFACGIVLFAAILLLYTVTPELFTPGTVLDNLRYIGRSATFSGRTKLWDTALRAIADKPIIGWSFDSLFSVGDRYVIRASHFHNGYLELLVNGGLLGLMFVTAIIAQALYRLLHALQDDACWGMSLGLLLLLVLLHNLAEPSLGKAPTLLWVIFSLTFLHLSMPHYSAVREP